MDEARTGDLDPDAAVRVRSRPPGVFHVTRPSPAMFDAAAAAAEGAPFSYVPVGATAHALPAGFDHDVHAAVLGQGDAVWERARNALGRWAQFDLPWVEIRTAEVNVRAGELFVFASRQLGLWTLNACRVVYIVDEADRFGFAYGTLAGHVVAGEERFLCSRDAAGHVTFEIKKFSRPAALLVHLAGPLARRAQVRFSLDALDAMRRAVS